MTYNWPVSSKAGTTTTDAATDRIDQARADINQNIQNVNAILDTFNLGTEPANNKILKYNTTTDKFELADESGGDTVIGTHEMWIPSSHMYKAQGNSPCSDLTTVVASTGVTKNFFAFDHSTEEKAQFVIAMPKKWDEGNIKFKAYWTADTSNSGGVTWELGIEVKADDDVLSASFVKGTVDDTYINSNELHITPQSSNITPAGSPQPDQLSVFQIARKVSDSNDTLNSDAHLLGVKIYFTTESGTDD